jgi:hypothetical protein
MSTQKVLGLDLGATSLPDAIAAMVEAWYEAQDTEHDSVLSEYINQILSHPVEWQKTSNRTITATVADIMEIRKNQTNRSKASAALYHLGIGHSGKNAKTIWLDISKLPQLLGGSERANNFCKHVANLPNIEFNKNFYHEIIEFPISYFLFV